jgi:thiamine kinase-like enzyme
MSPLDADLVRLRALAFWPREISIEPLTGGITNRNYLVSAGSDRYVARIQEERPALGIDRLNEAACQRAAWAIGVAPEVLYHERGVLVSAHVSGRTLGVDDLQSPDMLARLGSLLRTLHEGRIPIPVEPREFSVFETIQSYLVSARCLKARLPDEINSFLEESEILARDVGPFTPVLCHNDLLAANILAQDDRLWLIDWEYAGIGHPLFDLASVCANNSLSESNEVELLMSYQGSASTRDLERLRFLKRLSILREALWATIQAVEGGLAFDYGKYAEQNFRAFRRARIEPTAPSRRGAAG